MPTSTAIVAAPNSGLAALSPLVESAIGYAADARAEATRRAYAADWRAFETWCEDKGLPALPASAPSVAVYLAALADAGRKVSTIERALSGIASRHRTAGLPWPKGQPQIREVLAGIRRRLGSAPARKAPVGDADLAAIVATFGADLDGLRNRAIVTLGWFGAFRRAELAALAVSDVTFTADGLVVRIRRSKTDQDGHGSEKGIPYAGTPSLCPVRALRAWLDAAGIVEGSLLRASGRTVARVVQRAARAAGLDATRFGGHSLRAGFATTAAKKGKTLDAIMRQTGHRSERVARGYIRHATLFVDNAAAGLV